MNARRATDRFPARLAAALLATALPLLGCNPAPNTETVSPFDQLVAAERGFAARSRADGMREAFLANLAERSILFRPGPVDGREAHRNAPPTAGTLDWYPARAEVSASGDFGYTTGPWEFSVDGSEPRYGHYVSAWRKQADGNWQVELDIGNRHARPSSWTARVEPVPLATEAPDRASRDGFESALSQLDRELAAATQDGDPRAAYLRIGADDLTLYRNDRLPSPLPADGSWLSVIETCEPLGTGAAEAGDLGYSYGRLGIAGASGVEERHYARIWRNTAAGPRLVLDIEIP